MAKGNDMGEEIKVKEEEGYHRGDKREQPFVLLLRVTQASGKVLLISEFTGRAMAQMYKIAGLTPKEVVILTDQEVAVELEIETPIVEVSRAVHGLYQWLGNPYL